MKPLILGFLLIACSLSSIAQQKALQKAVIKTPEYNAKLVKRG